MPLRIGCKSCKHSLTIAATIVRAEPRHRGTMDSRVVRHDRPLFVLLGAAKLVRPLAGFNAVRSKRRRAACAKTSKATFYTRRMRLRTPIRMKPAASASNAAVVPDLPDGVQPEIDEVAPPAIYRGADAGHRRRTARQGVASWRRCGIGDVPTDRSPASSMGER